MEHVLLQQFFLGCLAHASYIVASEGVAAVIDPQRDVDLYLDFAREKSLSIEHIIETHLHADFVSGHHELAQRTGARIYLGEDAHPTFTHTALRHRDTLQFGNPRFAFLHTPGHTLESVCALLTDRGARSQPRDVELNRTGASAINQLPPPQPLSAPEVLRLQSEGAIVPGGPIILDTRPAMEFAVAHVPGSVHIALSGQYASWAARILGLDRRIILVGEDADHLRESQLRLARVGIENVHAYLEDGIIGWVKGGYELEYIPQVSVQ